MAMSSMPASTLHAVQGSSFVHRAPRVILQSRLVPSILPPFVELMQSKRTKLFRSRSGMCLAISIRKYKAPKQTPPNIRLLMYALVRTVRLPHNRGKSPTNRPTTKMTSTPDDVRAELASRKCSCSMALKSSPNGKLANGTPDVDILRRQGIPTPNGLFQNTRCAKAQLK